MNISNIIYNQLLLSRQKVYIKNDIINLLNIYSIDYIIDYNYNNTTFFICFCINNNVHNFINDVHLLSQIYNKHCICIYINYIKLDNNLLSYINKYLHFYHIDNINEQKIIKKIAKILYSYNVFYCDNSGDTIMINIYDKN